MKLTCYLFVLICLLVASCSHQAKQSGQKQGTVTHQITLADSLKPIITGQWVRKDYLEDVAKTRSPYRSSKLLKDITELDIDTSAINHDSLVVGCAYNDHEGGQFTLLFTNGNGINALKTKLIDYDVKSNFFELSYKISSRDTLLYLIKYDKNKKELDRVAYKRVFKTFDTNQQERLSPLDYEINGKLVAGKYIMLDDSTGSKDTLELTRQGKVLHMIEFNTYALNTDFVAGPENNIDMIYFTGFTEKQYDYAFKLAGDTLKLFTTKENEDHTLLLYDKLRYTLIRQNH